MIGVKMRRRTPDTVKLTLIPVLLGASVAIGTGWAWGVAEFGALVAWWLVTVYALDKGRRLRRHEGAAFAHWVWALTAVAFAATAGVPVHRILPLPVGTDLVAALVIGTAGVGAMWPAQRRFYALQRAAGPDADRLVAAHTADALR